MAAIVFPSNPDMNQTFVVGDVTWRWNGVSWVSNSSFNGRVPAGSSGQRPADPKLGMIRYNTGLEIFEGYDSEGWRPFDENPIRQPNIVSPEDDEELIQGVAFTLVSSPYVSLVSLDRASTDWQIATDVTFSTIIEESLGDTTNLESYEVTNGIADLGTYYWRVRYRDTAGNVSNWSPLTSGRIIVAPPDQFGQAAFGGFYIGTTSVGATCYYLIVAPNATGCASCQWKTTRTATSGTASLDDGFANTYPAMQNAEHPAGNWTATRTIGGFSDWYLPAIDELSQLYINDGGATNTTLPAGEGFAAAGYWSSTEGSATNAYSQGFSNGNFFNLFKTYSLRVRAVRRTPI